MNEKSAHFVTRWHPVSVLGRSIVELFRAASFEASLLTVVLVVQGLIPAFALYLTKRTVESIAQVAQGGSVNLIFLAVLWVSVESGAVSSRDKAGNGYRRVPVSLFYSREESYWLCTVGLDVPKTACYGRFN